MIRFSSPVWWSSRKSNVERAGEQVLARPKFFVTHLCIVGKFLKKLLNAVA